MNQAVCSSISQEDFYPHITLMTILFCKQRFKISGCWKMTTIKYIVLKFVDTFADLLGGGWETISLMVEALSKQLWSDMESQLFNINVGVKWKCFCNQGRLPQYQTLIFVNKTSVAFLVHMDESWLLDASFCSQNKQELWKFLWAWSLKEICWIWIYYECCCFVVYCHRSRLGACDCHLDCTITHEMIGAHWWCDGLGIYVSLNPIKPVPSGLIKFSLITKWSINIGNNIYLPSLATNLSGIMWYAKMITWITYVPHLVFILKQVWKNWDSFAFSPTSVNFQSRVYWSLQICILLSVFNQLCNIQNNRLIEEKTQVILKFRRHDQLGNQFLISLKMNNEHCWYFEGMD